MTATNLKWIRTGVDDLNRDVGGRTLPSGSPAVNYTPTEIASEGTDKISAHIKGIDNALGSIPTTGDGDVSLRTMNLENDRTTWTNITDLVFSMGITMSFVANVTMRVAHDSANVSETFTIEGSNNFNDWNYKVSSVGDDSGFQVQVTAGGQIQYKSANFTNPTLGTISYKAETLND